MKGAGNEADMKFLTYLVVLTVNCLVA